MEPIWKVTEEKVNKVIETLLTVGQPKKLIIFGSWASGKADDDSDLDVLVVVSDDVPNTLKESVRLRSALKGLIMAIDIVVVRESDFEDLKDSPGLIYREALQNGKLIYEAA
jgi:uncharacterized protein